jgi:hypothetical protein
LLRAPAGTPPWGIELIRQIEQEFLNRLKLPMGGQAYGIGNLPSATANAYKTIPLIDGAGDVPLATSDGTVWRYPDGTTV